MPVASISSTLGPLDIAYECEGRGQPLLLVMGLGAPMTLWDPDFRGALAARGFNVIRYDHRDVGGSTRLLHLPTPRVARAMGARLAGLPVKTAYTLADLANDAVGLLDHLGHARAHIVGISMGGMLAQHLAFGHGARVRSMASIMSTPGARRYLPSARALRAITQQPVTTAQGYEDAVVATFRIIGSQTLPRNEEAIRAAARASWARGPSAVAGARHLEAVLADGDRTARLAGVRAPTVVIHGDQDPLQPISGGRATARAIADAWWVPVPDMGHDLPRARWPHIIDAIVANTRRAVA